MTTDTDDIIEMAMKVYSPSLDLTTSMNLRVRKGESVLKRAALVADAYGAKVIEVTYPDGRLFTEELTHTQSLMVELADTLHELQRFARDEQAKDPSRSLLSPEADNRITNLVAAGRIYGVQPKPVESPELTERAYHAPKTVGYMLPAFWKDLLWDDVLRLWADSELGKSILQTLKPAEMLPESMDKSFITAVHELLAKASNQLCSEAKLNAL